MKKLTLPVLLLTAAMLVACDSGTTVIPEKTTDPTTTSLVLAMPTTDESTTITASTTLPAVTSAPITYPVLYERPEITGTHDNVVPVIPIESFQWKDELYSTTVHTPSTLEQKLDDLEGCDYIIALVTPIEIKAHETTARIAIEHIYVEHIVTESRRKYMTDSTQVVLNGCDFMYGYGWYNDYSATQVYNSESIPITTTGGKYVMILELRCWEYYGDGEPEDLISPYYIPFPLTWELDMVNVPGSTGDDWNRPPFIGYAEDYYAFGFGDVWERYMAK